MTCHGPECEILQNSEEVPTLRLALTLPWAMCWWVFSVTETSKAFQLTKQRMLLRSHLHSVESHSRRTFWWREEKKEKFARHFLGTALTTVDRGGGGLTAGHIKAINQLVWSLNGKNNMTAHWNWMKGASGPVELIFLFKSKGLKATAVHPATVNEVKSTPHQKSLIKSLFCIFLRISTSQHHHTQLVIVRWINSEFPP